MNGRLFAMNGAVLFRERKFLRLLRLGFSSSGHYWVNGSAL